MQTFETPAFAGTEVDMPKVEKRAPLADQAYDIVKGMIIANHATPGQLLMESYLAKRLGISRSPLREALTRLQQEGLVEVVPWKGARVAPLTPKYIREVYEVRAALECFAARKAAPFLSDQELDEMEEAFEAERPFLEQGAVEANNEIELRFHGLCVEKCDNDLLRDSLTKLGDHLARIRAFAGAVPENMKASYDEHWEILAAMRTKDPDVLERALRDHLSNIVRRLNEVLERNSGK